MSNVKNKSLKYEHIGQMIFEVNFAPNIQKLCKPIENHSIFYFLFWSWTTDLFSDAYQVLPTRWSQSQDLGSQK